MFTNPEAPKPRLRSLFSARIRNIQGFTLALALEATADDLTWRPTLERE
jgi:hypothetical protein